MQPKLTNTDLTKKDRNTAVILLANAFHDNPAHTYIYPEENIRREQMQWLMRKNLNVQFSLGQSFAEKSSEGSIMAMGFWHPPDTPQVNPIQLLRFGFFLMPFIHGMPAFKRMLNTVKQIEDRRKNILNGRSSWYLNDMVVSPDLRGQGLGKRVLNNQLESLIVPSRQPATLTTQKPENVIFYRSLGFKVVNDEMIRDGDASFQNWIMMFDA